MVFYLANVSLHLPKINLRKKTDIMVSLGKTDTERKSRRLD